MLKFLSKFKNFLGINWQVRFSSTKFYVQVFLSVLVPVLAYYGMTFKDLTTWYALGDVLSKAVSNPYVLGSIAVSVGNAIIDPTTSGIKDSKQALNYSKPKKD